MELKNKVEEYDEK